MSRRKGGSRNEAKRRMTGEKKREGMREEAGFSFLCSDACQRDPPPH